ncbi:hypothetical protein GMSM_43210 [Geomonas sp. Red276]
MKKALLVSWLLVLVASFPVYADSIIRVQCDDDDAGTEVYVNEKFVGECPVDVPVKEGAVTLRARKMVNNDFERVFQKKLRVAEGVAQRVEIVLSAPQMTQEAKQRKEQAELLADRQAAEGGDVIAMEKMAIRYDFGKGVTEDAVEAARWRQKAEETRANVALKAANNNDLEAMKDIADRFETGKGVPQDSERAQAWRNKIKEVERTQAEERRAWDAKMKEEAKQARIDQISYFQNTKEYLDRGWKEAQRDNKEVTYTTCGPVGTIESFLADLTSMPTVSYKIHQIKNEAALRPSTWGKPDSMMAQAASRYRRTEAIDDARPVVVAGR